MNNTTIDCTLITLSALLPLVFMAFWVSDTRNPLEMTTLGLVSLRYAWMTSRHLRALAS